MKRWHQISPQAHQLARGGGGGGASVSTERTHSTDRTAFSQLDNVFTHLDHSYMVSICYSMVTEILQKKRSGPSPIGKIFDDDNK